MSSASRKLIQASGGAAGEAEPAITYVDDVFSTFVYAGNASTRTITNGIALADGPANGTELHLTGDNLTDSSPVPKTITVNGNTQVSTSTKKYGTGSIQFDGSGDYLSISSNASFGFGTGDFTIEFWAYANSTTNYPYFIDGRSTATANEVVPALYINNGNYEYWVSGAARITGGAFPLNQWVHVALVRNGNTTTLYSNGTSTGSFTDTHNYVSTGLTIGQRKNTSNQSLNGYIDDLRITKGKARYTSAFTPPTEALALDTFVDGKGGLVWIKNRTRSCSHALYDTVRGPSTGTSSSTNKTLGTSITNAEGIGGSVAGITSFTSTGFITASDQISPYNVTGPTSEEYVSWTFAKQPGFFDIVTYTGNGGSAGNEQQISHNLGSKPAVVIIKRTDSTGDWFVFTDIIDGSNDYAKLNTTAAFSNSSNNVPTDSVFNVGGQVNYSGGTYIAYLFANNVQEFGTNSDESIIKCGSYTGNGSTNGPEIDLGFEAQWVMVKRTDSTGLWLMADVMRGMPVGGVDPYLQANAGDAEYTSYGWIRPTATGFKLENTGTSLNGSGATYVYIAIRRPHKPASEFEATDMFNTGVGVYNAYPTFQTGFVTDMGIEKNVNGTDGNYIFSRLTGGNYLKTENTNSETSGSSVTWDYQDGMLDSFGTAGNYNWWGFKRVPGFFDVVAYTGQSAEMDIDHNLGVTPELIITKRRNASSGYNWNSWYTGLTNSQYVNLNGAAAVSTSSNLWGTNSTVATDSVFRVGAATTGVNAGSGGTHIAYLFATTPGISKVGTFTRTSGDTTNVDCGFSNGARFVLWKRVTGGTGNWTVYDTYRGITAGSDPYFFLNSSGVQVTGTDYIDPYSAGFTVASGIASGTFLFLAIA